jgi:hypothetical protein
MKKMWFLLMFVIILMATPSAFAQSGATGLITLENVVCSDHTFTAYWQVNNTAANNVVVFVWTSGTGYVAWAGARSGPENGSFLEVGTYYAFELLSDVDSSYDYSSGYFLWQVDQQC